MTDVEEEFEHLGVVRGGELMLPAADAVALVRVCRDRKVRLLGVDAFRLTDTTTQPNLGESIDLSEMQYLLSEEKNWDRAERFLLPRVGDGLFYNVVIRELLRNSVVWHG